VKTLLIGFTAVCTFVCLPLAANAQIFWEEDFDAYYPGGLIGNDGWAGWGGSWAADAEIVTSPVHSPPNAVEILPTTDVVRLFSGATYGTWVITAWCYVPANSTGQQYWIWLNTYTGGGTDTNWSVQVQFDSDAGLVGDYWGAGIIYPIIFDDWVELRVEVDLDTNTQSCYYDNQLLYTDSWTEHFSGGGALEIRAIDLFSDGGSSIYWDDIIMAGPGAVAVEQTTWGELKASYK
jgi:hypothetical protein